MARKPRIEFAGVLYHVIARGNNKQVVFNTAEDYLYYLDRLRVAKEQYNFCLYSYCLMPNHVHLFIRTKETPLSHIMLMVQTSYAKYYNRKTKRVGHLFQNRYKAILCDIDAYLLELVRYIHLNPVRAGK
ncbi:MAG: transposase [Actinomycetota bacterium]